MWQPQANAAVRVAPLPSEVRSEDIQAQTAETQLAAQQAAAGAQQPVAAEQPVAEQPAEAQQPAEASADSPLDIDIENLEKQLHHTTLQLQLLQAQQQLTEAQAGMMLNAAAAEAGAPRTAPTTQGAAKSITQKGQ